MARQQSHNRRNLIPNALMQFWEFGYHGTGVEDLVRRTGLSRSSLYSEHQSKNELFKACLLFYTTVLADESVSYMETPDARLDQVRRYFDCVLSGMEEQTPPYMGCFLGNTMSECAPHDEGIRTIVEAFNDRLRDALLNVLRNETQAGDFPEEMRKNVAQSWMTSVQGIWSYSRSVRKPEDLESAVNGFIMNARALIQSLEVGRS
ncbi:MAG: TetR/AcrR family transcriptional regulator [Pseudomonadota bacterium]